MSKKEDKMSLSHYYPFTLRHLNEEDSKIICMDPKGDSIAPNPLVLGRAGKGRPFILSGKAKRGFLEICEPLSGDIIDFLPIKSARD